MRTITAGIRFQLAAIFLVILAQPVAILADTIADLGNDGSHSLALFINNEGDVVGKTYSTSTNYLGFFFSGANPVDGLQSVQLIEPFPGGKSTQPTGLNSSGEVSGFALTSGSAPNAFVFYNGVTTDLGTLGTGTNSDAYGLNDAGVVVGSGLDSSSTHAMVVNPVSPATDPPTWTSPQDVGTLGSAFAQINFVNDSSQFAGNTDSLAFYGTDLSSSNPLVSADAISLTGATTSTAAGISASGQVIGKSNFSGSGSTEHGFLYTPGSTPVITDLGTLISDGGSGFIGSSDAEAINSSGDIIGESDYATAGNPGVDSGHHHAYLYANSVMTDLGTLTGFTDSVADAINTSGVIVGTACISTGCTSPNSGTSEAFIYINNQMIDLTSLLPDNTVFTDLLTATGINDSDEVIGQGITASGQKDAYVFAVSLDPPAPEPSTMASMALGLLLCAVLMKRRRRKGSGVKPQGHRSTN